MTKKKLRVWMLGLSMLALLCGCGHIENSSGEENGKGSADFVTGSSKTSIRILSGSENKELESALEECARREKLQIEVDFRQIRKRQSL